jgi:hypothetical protein
MKILIYRLVAVIAVAVAFAGCAHLSSASRNDRELVPTDDMRSKVGGVARKDETTYTALIDPDRSIFGIPIGTTEEEFILKRGKPRGYVRLHDGGMPSGFVRMIGEETAMIYGNSQAFIFESGKLVGVRISPMSLFDWRLTSHEYKSEKWQLSNGIESDMNLTQVRNLLGDKLAMRANYQYYYKTTNAVVELDFMHWSDRGNTEHAYQLSGILVRYGANEPEIPLLLTREETGIVGMLVERGLKFPKVKSVYFGGPAEKAGIESGMVILSVNGRNLNGTPMDEAVGLLRGKVGEKVTVEVLDLGNGKRNTVTMTRVSPSDAGKAQ